MRNLRATLRHLLSLALSLLAFTLLARRIDLQSVRDAFGTVHPGWLLATCLSLALYTVIKSIRWQRLLHHSGAVVSHRESLVVLMIGQALNTFIPLRVGDVARIYLMGRHGMSRALVFGTLIVEKGVDLICYTALFFCFHGEWRCPIGRARLSPR
ncbi:MAG: flippase-like domain-containing protein [Anaerolineales bacterium]|nr:flippase-like domain-containing protein [Anaerolineales bacterium]MCB9126547.1 flippase-like domain-containing protein [Ardenticatenales bacterium]